MKTVQLPNGQTRTFPDEATEADILSTLESFRDKPKDPNEVWNAALQNMRQGVQESERAGKNLMIGTSKLGRGVLDFLPDVAGFFSPNTGSAIKKYTTDKIFPTKEEYNQFLGVPEQEQTWKDKLTQSLPQLAGAMATGPKALTQALYAGTTAPDNRLLSASVAGILPGVLEKGISQVSRLLPSQAALKYLSNRVGKKDISAPLAASERINTPLTPAEITGSEVLGKSQKVLGRTPFSEEKLTNFAQQRAANIEREAGKFSSNLYNPAEEKTLKNTLYEKTKGDLISPTELPLDNKIFQMALDRVEKSPVYNQKLKDAEMNSVEYLHQVKRKMDAMERLARKKDPNAALEIGKARDELRDSLYNASPEFAQAQEIAGRDIARRKFDTYFNKRDMNANNLSKFFKDKEGYESLKWKLADKPEAIRQMDDLKTVVDKISGAKTKQQIIISQPGLKITDIWNKPFEAVVNKAWKNKYDDMMTELITNPKWATQLSEMSKTKDVNKLTKSLINMVSQSAAHQ